MASPRQPVREAVRSANDIQKARKKRVNWTISELDQELKWRAWFPQFPFDWTANFTEADPEAAKLYEAFVLFCEENLFIKFPGKGKIPFQLRDAQKAVAWDFVTNRKNLALKARQIGFSTIVAAWVLWQAFGWAERDIVLLSKNERDSVKLLGKARYAYRNMPEWVRLRGPALVDKTTQRMTFDNESMLESLPSGNDPARGEALFLIVIDEIGFLPNAEEAWAAVEATTDLGGRTICLGTAKGEGTFFHEQWLQSDYHGGDNGFHAIFHGWRAVDTRDDDWYAQKKRELPAWQLHQEYPNTPEEAFVGSGNPFFDGEVTAKFVTEAGTEWTISATSRKDVGLYENGPLTIWEAPDHEARYTYAIGVDIAEGLEHGDWTVAWVCCVNTGRPVAVWRGHLHPDIFGETVLPAIGWFYRDALIAPELNNHGHTVLAALQRVKYKWLYRRRTYTKRQNKPLESMGWLTTPSSKALLADELQAWLREEGRNVPDKTTIHEIRTFSRDERGRLSGTPHDDCVMALGIAVQAMKYARTEHVSSETSADKVKGSFAWWEKRLKSGSGREMATSGIRPSGM